MATVSDMVQAAKKHHFVLFVFFAVFVLILFCNLYTPKVFFDDYTYSYFFTMKGSISPQLMNPSLRIKSLMDIVSSMYCHYMVWGGRIIADSIAQLFLMEDHLVLFDICNSLIFCLLIYLICVNACRSYRVPAWIVLLSFCLYWFLSPVMAETTLWLIGACNYLWTTTLILLAVTLYRMDSIRNANLFQKILFILLCLAAGWSNENTSLALPVYIVIVLIQQRQKHLSPTVWHYLGLVFAVIGYILLLVSPGNYLRYSILNHGQSTTFIHSVVAGELPGRIRECIRIIIYYYYKAFLLDIGLFLALLYMDRRKKQLSAEFKIDWILFLLASLGINFSMIASPFYPPRSSEGVLVFLIIDLCMVIFELSRTANPAWSAVPLAAAVLLAAGSLYHSLPAIYAQGTYERYIETVLESKKNSNEDVVISYHASSLPQDTHAVTFFHGEIDLTESSQNDGNIVLANYYGVRSVLVVLN